MTTPIARGPLTDLYRSLGATITLCDGWEVATAFPLVSPPSANRLIDRSHRPTWELNGPDTGAALHSVCGADVALRRVHSADGWEAYRLTPQGAILFGGVRPPAEALDVTGGWASLALSGPDAETILNKVTAVDLRERTLPTGGCCQGPIFGVNTLFGRFADRFELHVCTDSAEFFREVLLDAGAEFGLAAAAES